MEHKLKEAMVKIERLSGHFAKYPQNPDTMAINLLSAIGTIAQDALMPNVEVSRNQQRPQNDE